MTAPISSSSKFNSSARSDETQRTSKAKQGFSRGREVNSIATEATPAKNATVFSRETAASEKDENCLTRKFFSGLGSNAYALLPKRLFNHLNRNAAQPPTQQFYLPAQLPVRQHPAAFGQAAMMPPPYSANPVGNQYAPPAYSPRMGPLPVAADPLPAYAGLELGQSVLMPNDILITRF